MRKTAKIGIVAFLAVAVVAVLALKQGSRPRQQGGEGAAELPPVTVSPGEQRQTPGPPPGLPRLLELGSVTCVPCKMMAPILEELRQEYSGMLQVDFIDVWESDGESDRYDLRVIPTQIFFDAGGKELFRHEGFFAKEDILAKWEELGLELVGGETAVFERLTPAQADLRPEEAICYMCDGDIDPKALVVVRTDKGDVRLCSPHCYFIMYSCLTEDTTGFQQKVAVTDYAEGTQIRALDAAYLYGVDPASGRPWVRAFASADVADREKQEIGGSIVDFQALRALELSHRCGFCDRACYPQDAAEVIAGGIHTWGCCSHCALGVAARTGLDIEVRQPDRLTGEMVLIKTLNGNVASMEPASAVAWFGLRQKADGTWGSAGCFHQGFFTNEENLRAWAEVSPSETGRQITIQQALSDKMKLNQQQIAEACKIGECAPK
jgi:thioredoxin 1